MKSTKSKIRPNHYQFIDPNFKYDNYTIIRPLIRWNINVKPYA